MPTDPPIDSLTDPESLRAYDGVDVRDETHDIDPAEFADAAELDSHVVVGLADDRGVLLQNDGHHGWTLPAFPVADGDDWLAVARDEFDALAGVSITVDAIERLRVHEYRVPDADESTRVYNVVVRATPSGELSEDPESRVDGAELQWFEYTPADVPDAVAADVTLFVD